LRLLGLNHLHLVVGVFFAENFDNLLDYSLLFNFRVAALFGLLNF